MTQPLNYETPTEPRLIDIDPRWLRSLVIATILLAIAYALAFSNSFSFFTPRSTARIVISLSFATLNLFAAIFFVARPPMKLGPVGLRPALLTAGAAASCLSAFLQWAVYHAFVNLTTTTGPPALVRSWWFSYLTLASLLASSAFRFLLFYYLSLILKLLSAPRLSHHALILAIALPTLLLFQRMSIPFLGALGGPAFYTPYSILMMLTAPWALAVLIPTIVKLSQLLPRPS